MSGLESIFMQHVAQHGLNYGTKEEFNFRKSLYEQVDKEITTHNADEKETSTMAHNYFSTWSTDEKKHLFGFKPSGETKLPTILEESNSDSVNWVT